jgi:hypothetical protein
MTGKELQEILEHYKKQHKKWLDAIPEGKRADLSGWDLRGADLRGAVLEHAILRGANLSGAFLCGADLSKADLSRTIFCDADLSGASLRRAQLYGTDLRGANLNGANLSGANLNEANLSGANLRGADLTNATLIKASLNRANLTAINLNDFDPRKAKHLISVGPVEDKNDIVFFDIENNIVKIELPKQETALYVREVQIDDISNALTDPLRWVGGLPPPIGLTPEKIKTLTDDDLKERLRKVLGWPDSKKISLDFNTMQTAEATLTLGQWGDFAALLYGHASTETKDFLKDVCGINETEMAMVIALRASARKRAETLLWILSRYNSAGEWKLTTATAMI